MTDGKRFLGKLVGGALGLLLFTGIVLWAGLALTYQEPARGGGGKRGFIGDLWTHAFPASTGGDLRLADLSAQALVVEFWATWCGPCHVQAEVLRELYPKVRPQGVEFVGVALGEERALVEEFLARKPLPYPVLFDPEGTSERYLSIPALPKILVVTRKGEVVLEETGVVSRTALERALRSALAS